MANSEAKRIMALLNMQAMVANVGHECMSSRDDLIERAKLKDMVVCEGPSPDVQAMIDQHRKLGSLRESSLCYEMPEVPISEVCPRRDDDFLVLSAGNMADYTAQIKLNNMMLGHGYTDMVKLDEPKKAQGSPLLLGLLKRV